ncbi:unnamed protein product, partial [marine sediment metagenome]
LPDGVEVVAAAKTRTPGEVLEAVQAGIKIIGENYVKEAKEAYELVGNRAKWHFIGTFQKHNVRRKVLEIFDMIESADSLEIAREIDRRCAQIGKIMPILIEVNSGRESQKSGVLPGMESILAAAAKFGELYGIAGGFHGFHNFEAFHGLSLICPCHCTTYKQEIRDLFKDKALDCGAGLAIEL